MGGRVEDLLLILVFFTARLIVTHNQLLLDDRSWDWKLTA